MFKTNNNAIYKLLTKKFTKNLFLKVLFYFILFFKILVALGLCMALRLLLLRAGTPEHID